MDRVSNYLRQAGVTSRGSGGAIVVLLLIVSAFSNGYGQDYNAGAYNNHGKRLNEGKYDHKQEYDNKKAVDDRGGKGQIYDNGKIIHSDGYGTFQFTKGEGKYFYKNLYLDKGGNRYYIDNGRKIKEDGKGYFDGKGQYHKDAHHGAEQHNSAPSYSSLPQQALALGKFAGEDTAALISLLTSSNDGHGGRYTAPAAPFAPTYSEQSSSPVAYNAETESITSPSAPPPYPVITSPDYSNNPRTHSSQERQAYPAHALIQNKMDVSPSAGSRQDDSPARRETTPGAPRNVTPRERFQQDLTNDRGSTDRSDRKQSANNYGDRRYSRGEDRRDQSQPFSHISAPNDRDSARHRSDEVESRIAQKRSSYGPGNSRYQQTSDSRRDKYSERESANAYSDRNEGSYDDDDGDDYRTRRRDRHAFAYRSSRPQHTHERRRFIPRDDDARSKYNPYVVPNPAVSMPIPAFSREYQSESAAIGGAQQLRKPENFRSPESHVLRRRPDRDHENKARDSSSAYYSSPGTNGREVLEREYQRSRGYEADESHAGPGQFRPHLRFQTRQRQATQ